MGDDFVVLLDYYEASKAHIYRNLFRLRPDGSLVWTINAAEAHDVVTDVQWRDGNLVAWTWGCYMLTIDKSTGVTLASVFTK
jgi:hypothetical protein